MTKKNSSAAMLGSFASGLLGGFATTYEKQKQQENEINKLMLFEKYKNDYEDQRYQKRQQANQQLLSQGDFVQTDITIDGEGRLTQKYQTKEEVEKKQKEEAFNQEYKRKQMEIMDAGVENRRALLKLKQQAITSYVDTEGLDLNNQYMKNLVEAGTGLSNKFALQGKKNAPWASQYSSYLKFGEINNAKNELIQGAKETFGQEQKTSIEGYSKAYAELNHIKTLLNTVPTGLATGTIEQIVNKLGQTSDPALKSLGVEIKTAKAEYVKAMTGVAANPTEMKEFQSIFPNIDQSFDLNTAQIDGFNNSIKIRLNALFQGAIRPDLFNNIFGGDASQYIIGGEQSNNQQQGSGSQYELPPDMSPEEIQIFNNLTPDKKQEFLRRIKNG